MLRVSNFFCVYRLNLEKYQTLSNNNTIIKKIGLPLLCLLPWIILYLLPRSLYYTIVQDGMKMWLLFVFATVLLPYFLYFILKKNNFSTEKSTIFAGISTFLLFPFFIIIEAEGQQELKNYGKETIGLITKAQLRKPKKGQAYWNVQAKYKINEKTYITKLEKDEDQILQFGDSVVIIYSPKVPELSKIKTLSDYYE